MALEPGKKAPAFTLASTEGGEVSLASLRGQKVVLYFYPKDDTPGCTREACAFRDALPRFRGARVLGVSKDSLAAHEKFRGKYGLPFPLLSDPGNAVARAYGAFGKKKLYGREIEGTLRSTFLIDEEGRIAAAWSPVRVDGHAEEVLAALDELGGTRAAGKTGTRAAGRKSGAPAPARKAAREKPSRPSRAAQSRVARANRPGGRTPKAR